MGTFTLTKTNRLFWLGRYLERVFTALKEIRYIYEAETDGKEADFDAYCRKLGIPNIYENTADFCHRYVFDTTNPNSVASNLGYAYDNAIVLRETISSYTLSYVQMAMNAMEMAAHSDSPGVQLQWVEDDIMAFRGACEEMIDDEATRFVIKTGASVERVDLYLRLDYDQEIVEKKFVRLFDRMYKSKLSFDRDKMNILVDAMLDKTTVRPPKPVLVNTLETLLQV